MISFTSIAFNLITSRWFLVIGFRRLKKPGVLWICDFQHGPVNAIQSPRTDRLLDHGNQRNIEMKVIHKRIVVSCWEGIRSHNSLQRLVRSSAPDTNYSKAFEADLGFQAHSSNLPRIWIGDNWREIEETMVRSLLLLEIKLRLVLGLIASIFGLLDWPLQ